MIGVHRMTPAFIAGMVFIGAHIDVMESDAAQYAEISRQLAAVGDWLHFHWRGHDYLDKPPLLFWLSALSFKLFGVHNWSYKLPSILFAFLGTFALHRWVRRMHPAEVASAAALMYSTTAAFLLMTNDVRCDTILTACIVIAVQQGDAYQHGRQWRHLLGCTLAIGLGMLAKGPIGLMAPLLALLPPVLLTRKWRTLADGRLWVVPLVLALMLLPMCIGLYQQHGAHGLRFYFWEQSFGRITGENRWKDESTVLYFLHEVPWLLLPWTVFVALGLWSDLRTWMRAGSGALPETTSICGALSLLLAMSLSGYKLPHYIYPAIPMFCVVGARGLHAGGPAWLVTVQNSLMVGLIAGATVLMAVVFGDERGIAPVLLGAAGLAATIVAWVRSHGVARAMDPAMITAIVCALMMNAMLYPFLLRYGSNAQAGHAIHAAGIHPAHVAGFRNGGAALDFYTGAGVPWFDAATDVLPYTSAGHAVFTDERGERELLQLAPAPGRVQRFDDFPVQQLSIDFLLPSRRPEVVQRRVLLIY